MKAVILVGGLGTRLRPLTTNIPKSVVPFAGRPMVEWQIEALVKFGVKEIILTIFYKESLIQDFMLEMEKKYNVKIIASVESVPLNTGGPIKLAEKYLLDPSQSETEKSKNNTFFVLNSDIICDYPFEALYNFHLTHEGEVTILSHPVDDPSRYGVIVADENSGRVKEFIEKPQVYVGNLINAGIYVFSDTVVKNMQPVAFSLERETFPKLAAEGKIFVFELKGFWKDIGIPSDFLACSQIYLDHFHRICRYEIDGYRLVINLKNFKGVNLIHRESVVDDEAIIGPYAVIHKRVVVGKYARVARSIVMDGTEVGEHSQVFDSILMFGIKVGRFVRIDKHSVIAENVVVDDEVLLVGKKIEPGIHIGLDWD